MTSSNEQLQLEAKQAQIIKFDRQCADDPVLFFNTFLYTFDPKREPYHLPFNLFPFQVNLVHNIVTHIETGSDLFIDKCREMGATYTVLGVLLWYWKYRDASNFLIGSRKEDVVDNTGSVKAGESSNKEESLFGKIDYMLERLPTIVLPTGFTTDRHRTYMNLRNPEIGNVISGESSNQNFSRGGRQKAIMLDEFAFWDNDDAAWGSTADTTNCRIVLTTPGIRPNTKAKRLRFGKDGEKIDIVSLPHELDPRKTPLWLAEQRARRSHDDFSREIMIDWEGAIAGVVYPEARYREIGNFRYEPEWPLYIAWDFGLDGTAIQWWQSNPKNGKIRLVDAFMQTDKPIQWFFPLLGEPLDSAFDYALEDINAIERTKIMKRAIHYGDPDVSKRSMTSRVLTSNRKELEKINIYVQTAPQSNSFVERREATKLRLQKGIEVNDTPGTKQWIECIDGARYPQRTDTSQATTAITLPIHDWTSHHRTALEYFCINYNPTNTKVAGIVTSVIPGEEAQSFVVDELGNIPNSFYNLGDAIKNNTNEEW